MEPESRRRKVVRLLLQLAGFLCVGLAVLGVFLPLLPTTPFLLLAAACFARSSPRFHRWLLEHRLFGPLIHDWQTHRALPARTKAVAIALLAVTFGTSIVLVAEPTWLQVVLAAVGLGLAGMLLRIPTRS